MINFKGFYAPICSILSYQYLKRRIKAQMGFLSHVLVFAFGSYVGICLAQNYQMTKVWTPDQIGKRMEEFIKTTSKKVE
jgi:hypothetical protein